MPASPRDAPEPAYGSDLVVALLEQAGIEHVSHNPGFSIKGLLDSVVARPGRPEPLLCLHEEIAVAAAHGYAKATGRPMAVLLHDIVGLQHATLAIFNAWCDRVPMLLLGGTGPLSKEQRRHWIDWIHTSTSQGELIRDYVKWEDQPFDVESIVPSFQRAWQTAVAAPQGPVYLCYDVELQETEIGESSLSLPAALAGSAPVPPGLDPEGLRWLADRLASARLPLLVADYAALTPAAFAALETLASLLHAPVVDCGARLNFPTEHPLNVTGLDEVLEQADLVVGFEVEDRDALVVGRLSGKEFVHVTLGHLRVRAWAEDALRVLPASKVFTGASEAVLPALATLVGRRPQPPGRLDERRRALSGRVAERRRAWASEARAAKASGGRIPRSRVAWEVGEAVRCERFALVAGSLGGWERRLWAFDAERPHLGGQGGGGCGYIAGAASGAALALSADHLCVAIVPDGDLLYTPAALWTMARKQIPLLMVMDDNGEYHNTFAHGTRLAAARGRAPEPVQRENAFEAPMIDFPSMARSFGVWATGPISDPEELQPALGAAVDVVRSGRPALVDVVTLSDWRVRRRAGRPRSTLARCPPAAVASRPGSARAARR